MLKTENYLILLVKRQDKEVKKWANDKKGSINNIIFKLIHKQIYTRIHTNDKCIRTIKTKSNFDILSKKLESTIDQPDKKKSYQDDRLWQT